MRPVACYQVHTPSLATDLRGMARSHLLTSTPAGRSDGTDPLRLVPARLLLPHTPQLLASMLVEQYLIPVDGLGKGVPSQGVRVKESNRPARQRGSGRYAMLTVVTESRSTPAALDAAAPAAD